MPRSKGEHRHEAEYLFSCNSIVIDTTFDGDIQRHLIVYSRELNAGEQSVCTSAILLKLLNVWIYDCKKAVVEFRKVEGSVDLMINLVIGRYNFSLCCAL